MWLNYYYNIYLIDKSTGKWKAPPHPHFPPAKAGRKRKAIPCSIDRLSWNLYGKVRTQDKYTAIKKIRWNEILDLVNGCEFIKFFFFWNNPIVTVTTCAGKEFQTFTILLKKKCFASFDLKSLPMILKPLLRVVLVRSVITWSFILILANFRYLY